MVAKCNDSKEVGEKDNKNNDLTEEGGGADFLRLRLDFLKKIP